MRANFVTVADERSASYRMRIQIPSDFINLYDEDIYSTISHSCDEECDVNIFSKHWNADQYSKELFESTTKTIFDVCDDHFDRDAGPYYEHMCAHADEVTCNTSSMQERIYNVTGRLAKIVEDPYTFNREAFDYSTDPKFIWYGSRVNIMSVYKWMRKVPNLTIICDLPNEDLWFPENVTYMEWKPGLVEEEIKKHDIVLLPKNDNPWAATKSPNRAVDALIAGKFVISDFPEVYGRLTDYIYIGDVVSGIDFYRRVPYTIERMVSNGQKYCLEKHSPELISKKWSVIIKD